MTTLLIDGDIFAYRCAVAEERGYDFGGIYSLQADPEIGIENLDALIENFALRLDASDIIVALTHSENFRKLVLPTYKANRKDVRKPMILGELRDHLTKKYKTYIRPKLEADDVLGILATNPHVIKDKKVIVSVDKDLRTIPAWHWNPDAEGMTGAKPVLVSEHEADAFFYSQILSGDITDGYGGCPNIGKKRAKEIVENPVILVKQEHILKSGKSKGKSCIKWVSEPTTDIWASIVSHYEKAGLTEEDALAQARCARILRHQDYNYKTKEPILWIPKNHK